MANAMATAMATQCQGGDAMDVALWGDLQRHIDLALIFAKLPLHHFFRLRLVCKHWNRLAADAKFLDQTFAAPIPKPYFVVDIHVGHRLLNYDAIGRAWHWTRLPRVKCEADGLLCEDADSIRVFNVHTRTVHVLPDFCEVREPPLPVEEEEDYDEPLVGMIADTSAKPYGFKLILGDELIGTRIYDSGSGSWTQKISTHEDSLFQVAWPRPTCAHWNGVLYIRVWRRGDFGTCDIHSYDLQRDEWSFEVLPGNVEEWVFCDIGAWNNRLFLFGMPLQPPRGIMTWELCNGISEDYSSSVDNTWSLFDCMPEDLCSWMLAGEEDKLHVGWGHKQIDINSRFCGEYVLVYNAVGLAEVAKRAVLYNLDSETWEKVELPVAVI